MSCKALLFGHQQANQVQTRIITVNDGLLEGLLSCNLCYNFRAVNLPLLSLTSLATLCELEFGGNTGGYCVIIVYVIILNFVVFEQLLEE